MGKIDVLAMIRDADAKQERARRSPVIAPRLFGSALRLKVDGLWRVIDVVEPASFWGWGRFVVKRDWTAELAKPATSVQISKALRPLPQALVVLVKPLGDRGTWLAIPAQHPSSLACARRLAPVIVHLVSRARQFDRCVARFDGRRWWFEALDVRADPKLAASMRTALAEEVDSDDFTLAGATPAHVEAYRLAWGQLVHEVMSGRVQSAEQAVADALALAGGELLELTSAVEHWLVRWRGPDRVVHYSAIQKETLTVLSAGICLSGEDRKFDLQSLVGVASGSSSW